MIAVVHSIYSKSVHAPARDAGLMDNNAERYCRCYIVVIVPLLYYSLYVLLLVCLLMYVIVRMLYICSVSIVYIIR